MLNWFFSFINHSIKISTIDKTHWPCSTVCSSFFHHFYALQALQWFFSVATTFPMKLTTLSTNKLTHFLLLESWNRWFWRVMILTEFQFETDLQWKLSYSLIWFLNQQKIFISIRLIELFSSHLLKLQQKKSRKKNAWKKIYSPRSRHTTRQPASDIFRVSSDAWKDEF